MQSLHILHERGLKMLATSSYATMLEVDQTIL
jgi:hypothetical protein